MRNEIDQTLKVFEKMGYPNKNFISICQMVGQEPHTFFADLYDRIGEEKTYEFVKKTLEKLETPGKGIKISWENGEYVYLIIEDFNIDMDDSNGAIFIDFSWGENMFYNENGEQTTLNQMDDEADMGDWGDLDEFYDWIKGQSSDQVFEKTGFGLLFGI